MLHNAIRECQACSNAGFHITADPLASGSAPAPFMLIGQAPSLTDQRDGEMYRGPAAVKLKSWLLQAGFVEQDFGRTIYFTALTKCFPGRLPGKSTDRAPSQTERSLCRHWLEQQIELVQPRVIILFGKMAIDTFLPKISLDQSIGRSFTCDGRTYLPLPHSSGASTWLNAPEHRTLLNEALEQLRALRQGEPFHADVVAML